MGWSRQRPNGKWQAKYRGPDGKERSAGMWRTEREADAAWKAAEVDMNRGEWLDPRSESYTVGAAYERWAATRTVEATSRRKDEAVWEMHVKPRWGHVRVDEVHALDVQAWVNGLSLSRGRAGNCLSLLSNALIGAVMEGKRRDNPCAYVRLPKDRTPRSKQNLAITREQVEQIAAAYPVRYRPIPLLAAYAGLRWGEILGLRVQDVDFLRGELTVSQVVVEVPQPQVRPYPKSESSRRTVPLDPVLRDSLAAALSVAPAASDGRIVTGRDGETPMYRSRHHADLWKPARDTVGLQCRLHDLRGAYGSWLIEQGVDVATVARLMGHSTAQVTWNNYVRSVGVDSRQVLDALRPAARPAAREGQA